MFEELIRAVAEDDTAETLPETVRRLRDADGCRSGPRAPARRRLVRGPGGEDRGAVIGEHFERGDDRAKARSWYVRAAEQANAATDFRSAIAQADRALALEAVG